MYNLNKHVIKYFLSAVFRQKEDTLFTLMHHYNTIIDISDVIRIITYFGCEKVRVAKCQHKVCAWRQTNVHTPRVSCGRRFPVTNPMYESPRRVNDMDLEFMGSAQGVPMELRCRRWQSMPARDPNSPPQYAHLKPNESGNFFLPPGIPPPALRLRRIV